MSGQAEWRVILKYAEGGPYQINFTSNSLSITLDDVMFGDVWFCAGQSNMRHRLEYVRHIYILHLIRNSNLNINYIYIV